MRTHRLHARLSCVAAIALALGWAATAVPAGAAKKSGTKPETTSLTIPLPASSAAVGYLVFAAQNGYYDKYGLSVSSPTSDSTQVKAALVGGAAPLVGIAVADTLNLVSSGVNLQVIGCQLLGVPFQVYAKADIKTAKDLKGRTLGVTSLTSGLGIAARKYLTTNGLKEADVTLVPLGSVPNALAALTAGRVDAALLSYPSYRSAATSGDLHKIGEAPASLNVYAASTDWTKANRNTILAFLQGNTEALAAYATDREAALPVLAKMLRLNLDDPTQGATVKEGYQLYHASFTPIHECTTTEFADFIPFLMPEEQATLVKPKTFVDNSYIRELVKAGFYTKITAKYGAFPGAPQ